MGLRCAIIGSGNIGTDLMMKVRRSGQLELAALIGIDPASDGLARARGLGVEATPDGIRWVADHRDRVDLVLDATSAQVHVRHAAVLADLGIPVIDLTPAARGPKVIPTVNLADHLDAPNLNLVTCGGQATTPIVAAVSRAAERPVRRDGLDRGVGLGRARHPAEHRRVHPDHGPGARGDRRRRARQGHHHPQPGRPADPDAQHGVLRAARGQRP